jgi:ribosomal-protein-alanine N-acetyltransferase
MNKGRLNVRYENSRATAGQIEAHLRECSNDFIPPLESRLDIAEYARKIKSNADTFEAWNAETLVGLVAMYVDQVNRAAFITSVSVSRDFSKLGIASDLIERSVAFARSRNCMVIRLQVNLKNDRAIDLYRKFSFKSEDETQDPMTMVLSLS